jgi:hypothetical protein
MKEMVVRTGQSFASPASTVWSLLCNSTMDVTTTLLFKLGVPHPVQCRVPDGHGGVGSERECVSDQGIVHQRILEWVPQQRLTIRVERTDLRIEKYVREMVETFDIVPTTAGVRVTRTTHVWTRGRFHLLKKLVLFFSLKQVHRYVFRNWRRLADRENHAARPPRSGAPSSPGL